MNGMDKLYDRIITGEVSRENSDCTSDWYNCRFRGENPTLGEFLSLLLEGGEWGLRNLPEEYHPLIRTALQEYGDGTDVRYDPETAKRYAAYMLKEIKNPSGPNTAGSMRTERRQNRAGQRGEYGEQK